jgi:hypothetical protein
MAPPLKPGAPADASTPTAADIALGEQRRRENETQRNAAHARGEDERAVYRDDSIEASRGGHDRAFGPDDWDRAAQRTDPERRRQIRAVMDDTLLPNLPKKDGWRRCWVSTNHPSDTPQRRLRLGYRFLKYDQVRREGWDADEYRVKDASNIYTECVMWREMVAMETDEENWTAIMRENHHDAPMDQAQSIYENLQAAGEEIRDRGGRTQMAPGMETLRQFRGPPKQFES